MSECIRHPGRQHCGLVPALVGGCQEPAIDSKASHPEGQVVPLLEGKWHRAINFLSVNKHLSILHLTMDYPVHS